MTYDYYEFIDRQTTCPRNMNEFGLVSGFVDQCTAWACKEKQQGQRTAPKDDARQAYMAQVKTKTVEAGNIMIPDFSNLPDSSWIGIKVKFTLETSWYSKDDRPFHVLDNPVRKDRVFGVPFMSAASWKGMLRWACRMQSGLADHFKMRNMKIDDWKDPEWILHLFGNEQSETESDKFKAGALVFYPTWFSKVGFEVINPHSRKTKAGTNPIIYEVVPANTPGFLSLLYAPLPGQVERDNIKLVKVVEKLIVGIEQLLQTYGISAKRTVGWGTANINKLEGFCKIDKKMAQNDVNPKKKILKSLQSLGELIETSVHKAVFSSEKVSDFKEQIQKHFTEKGGVQ